MNLCRAGVVCSSGLKASLCAGRGPAARLKISFAATNKYGRQTLFQRFQGDLGLRCSHKDSKNDVVSPGGEDRAQLPSDLTSAGLWDVVSPWLIWALFGAYIGWVYFSTGAPGNPVWATSPDTTQEFIHESVSIWYINPVMSWFHISLLPDMPENPVGEALFTVIVTWDILMWPLMLADAKSVGVKYKRELWYGSLALLSAFLLPYMALRQSNRTSRASAEEAAFPSSSRVYGFFGLVIAVATIGWLLFARPEYGDISDRINFAIGKFNSDRVFFALCVDCGIYAIIQFVLMSKAPLKYRLFPFVGLSLWLSEIE